MDTHCFEHFLNVSCEKRLVSTWFLSTTMSKKCQKFLLALGFVLINLHHSRIVLKGYFDYINFLHQGGYGQIFIKYFRIFPNWDIEQMSKFWR